MLNSTFVDRKLVNSNNNNNNSKSNNRTEKFKMQSMEIGISNFEMFRIFGTEQWPNQHRVSQMGIQWM